MRLTNSPGTRLLSLLTTALHAADGTGSLAIVSHKSSVLVGEQVILNVSGLDAAELKQVTATVTPAATLSSVGHTFDGKLILVFSSQASGSYRVTVALNGQHQAWRESLTETLSHAADAKVSAALLSELTSISGKLTTAYPVKTATVLLTVQSSQPTVVVPPAPTPPRVDPVPVSSGIVYTVVIRTAETLNVDQAEVLSDLRQWTDTQPPSKVTHFEFPPDAIGPDGNLDPKVATYVRKIPPGADQPYLFIVQKRESDGKSVVLYQSELPSNADEIIRRIKEYVR